MSEKYSPGDFAYRAQVIFDECRNDPDGKRCWGLLGDLFREAQQQRDKEWQAEFKEAFQDESGHTAFMIPYEPSFAYYVTAELRSAKAIPPPSDIYEQLVDVCRQIYDAEMSSCSSTCAELIEKDLRALLSKL